MSAERRWDQRRFHLEESLTQNGGARTVFIEHMTPGTTVPPHYHTRQYIIISPPTIPRSSPASRMRHSGPRSTFTNRNETPGFSETFDLLEGSITVYSSAQAPTAAGGDEAADLDLLERSAQALRPGQQEAPTVPPGVYHKYVVGEVDTVLRVVITPGDADFERLLMAQNGLAEDGELDSMGDSVVLMAVISG